MNEFERTKEMSLIKFINSEIIIFSSLSVVWLLTLMSCRVVPDVSKGGGGKGLQGITRRRGMDDGRIFGARGSNAKELLRPSLIRINCSPFINMDSRDEIRRKLNSSEEKKN